ncbi:MAG: GerAB/ArcD/ProY family transporter, partial [Anaerotignum sp.]|nr:GerAB/ArcD/ProY family transporter [Anaerotignum sp.]
LQVLLLLDSFGTAVLFLPAELAQLNGKACWTAALMGGGVFVLLSLLLAKMGENLPSGTVVEWCRGVFGYGLGSVILAGLLAKILLDGLLELRLFSEIICRAMLPDTPVWVISLVILLVAGTLAVQGAECRGRSGEVLFFAVILPLLLVLSAVAVSAEYGRTMPMSMPMFSGTVRSMLPISIAFQGLTFLYFVFPCLQKREKAAAAVSISSLLSTGILTVVVFLCLAVYGAEVLSEKLLPALQVMERVSFTGVFLTRQDLLLLWFWMASICIFLSGTLFYGSFLGRKLFRQKAEKQKKWLLGWLLLLFGASLLPENLAEAYRLRLMVSPWLNLLYLAVLPVLLLILAKRREWE